MPAQCMPFENLAANQKGPSRRPFAGRGGLPRLKLARPGPEKRRRDSAPSRVDLNLPANRLPSRLASVDAQTTSAGSRADVRVAYSPVCFEDSKAYQH